MAVGDWSEGELGQLALPLDILVAELVGDDDGDAVEQADAEDHAEVFVPGQSLGPDDPGAPDGDEELDRHEGHDQGLVVVVGLQRTDGVLGRVGLVGAEQQVERGDDQVDEQPRPVEGQRVSVRVEVPHRPDDQQGHDRAEQPEVALAIGPGLGGGDVAHGRLRLISPLFNGTFIAA